MMYSIVFVGFAAGLKQESTKLDLADRSAFLRAAPVKTADSSHVPDGVNKGFGKLVNRHAFLTAESKKRVEALDLATKPETSGTFVREEIGRIQDRARLEELAKVAKDFTKRTLNNGEVGAWMEEFLLYRGYAPTSLCSGQTDNSCPEEKAAACMLDDENKCVRKYPECGKLPNAFACIGDYKRKECKDMTKPGGDGHTFYNFCSAYNCATHAAPRHEEPCKTPPFDKICKAIYEEDECNKRAKWEENGTRCSWKIDEKEKKEKNEKKEKKCLTVATGTGHIALSIKKDDLDDYLKKSEKAGEDAISKYGRSCGAVRDDKDMCVCGDKQQYCTKLECKTGDNSCTGGLLHTLEDGAVMHNLFDE